MYKVYLEIILIFIFIREKGMKEKIKKGKIEGGKVKEMYKL